MATFVASKQVHFGVLSPEWSFQKGTWNNNIQLWVHVPGSTDTFTYNLVGEYTYERPYSGLGPEYVLSGVIDRIDFDLYGKLVLQTDTGAAFSPINAAISGRTEVTPANIIDLALAGADSIVGSDFNDTLGGRGGNDTIHGGAGDDVVEGGQGADLILGGTGQNFMSGGDGNDSIQGGVDFDRINGNLGADTVSGGGGADWVLGGQGSDVLFGEDGADILNGNLGNDTGDGGAGNDSVRGGQGDDFLAGGAGEDWLTGDLGNDTLTGGLGADAFRAFNGGGDDRITDFNASEGDRIQVDLGSSYTVSQVGPDTVIAFASGNTTALTGVTYSSLPVDWIAVV